MINKLILFRTPLRKKKNTEQQCSTSSGSSSDNNNIMAAQQAAALGYSRKYGTRASMLYTWLVSLTFNPFVHVADLVHMYVPIPYVSKKVHRPKQP